MKHDERNAAHVHEDALMKLYDLAVCQRVEWMHFHELAIADPFKAESEALTFCDEVQKAVAEAGIERGHDWRPHVY